MDELNNNSLGAKNEALFASLKASYPTLANVFYDKGNLIFPNGVLSLENIDLTSLNPSIFWMNSANLYIYLRNKFFKHNEEQYQKEINNAQSLFNKFVITEDDEDRLRRYAYDFWLRLKLFSSESVLAQDEEYVKELMARRTLITKSQNENSIASNIITETYNEQFNQSFTDDPNSNKNAAQSYEATPTNAPAQTNVFALTRTKPGLPKVIDDDNKLSLNMSGFTNIILVVGAAIIIGVLLGIALFK